MEVTESGAFIQAADSAKLKLFLVMRIPLMGQMKSIQLPTIFNVATHFVDRHITEGRGDRIAYECGDERVTYRQLFERVNRAGNALKKLGVRQEERVGLLLLDTPEFPYCFFGAIKIGAVPIPINTLLKPSEYEYILNDSRVRVLIVSEALLPPIQAIPAKSFVI